MIRERFTCLASAQILEDGVKKGKSLQRLSPNRRGCGKSFWLGLLDSDIVTEMHHFAKIPHQSHSLERGRKDKSTKHFFEVRVNSAPIAYGSIKGKKTWNSPAPHYQVIQSIDCDMLLHIADYYKSDWKLAAERWWCWLLSCVPMLVNNPMVHGARWYITDGAWAGSAGIGIPLMEKISVHGQVHYKHFEAVTDLQCEYLHVFDPSHWSAKRFKFVSPLGMEARGVAEELRDASIVPEGESKPMLRIAADAAFGDTPLSTLKTLAGKIGAEYVGVPTVFKLIVACLKVILEDDYTLEAVYLILLQKLSQNDPLWD